MSYEVIARKWRPLQFDDVVGQRVVTETLKNAIRGDRIAHAFLFSGVRGVGKTTTARILAKALNCVEGPTITPCDKCHSCIEISESRSVDVQEIDAASTGRVENIRELREGFRYGTARDRFKIYILDEAHMLSTSAANALLKSVEEPPPHVKFVLATTEPEKLPITIRSRCQHYEFRPIALGDILTRLRLICETDGVEISEFGLRSVATVARGSMRDAQSTLDKILALGGSTISDGDVQDLLGVVDEEILLRLVAMVAAGDHRSLLELLQEQALSGMEPENLCQKLMMHVRNLLVCSAAGWNEELISVADSARQPLIDQAAQFSELDLIRFYDLLNKVVSELRFHPQPFLHVEMALVKLMELSRLPSLEEVIGSLGAAGPQLHARSDSKPERILTQSREGRKVRKELEAARTVESGRQAPPVRETPPPQDEPAAPMSLEIVEDEDVVSRLESMLSRKQPAVFSLLRHAASIDYADQKLSIVFPGTESAFFQLVNSPEKRDLLGGLCRELTGIAPQVDLRLEDDGPADEFRVDPADDPRVQTFLKEFPGKIQIKGKMES